MYFKLRWSAAEDTSGLTDKQFLAIDVLDPDELLRNCENADIDTSAWLGKANSFVWNRGVTPSYGYFLISAESASVVLQEVNTIHVATSDYCIDMRRQRVSIEVGYDEYGLEGNIERIDDFGNPAKLSRTFRDLEIVKCEAVTPSLTGSDSVFLLVVADERIFLNPEFADQFDTEGEYQTNTTPIIERINEIVAYLSIEEIAKINEEIDGTTTRPTEGVFGYDLESIKDYKGNDNGGYTTSGLRNIKQPLDWKQVIEKILMEYGGGFYHESMAGGAGWWPQQQEHNTFNLDVGNLTFPTFPPSGILVGGYNKEVTIRSLKKILFFLGADLIYLGYGKWKLQKVQDNGDPAANELPNGRVNPVIAQVGHTEFDTALEKFLTYQKSSQIAHINDGSNTGYNKRIDTSTRNRLAEKKFYVRTNYFGAPPSQIRFQSRLISEESTGIREDDYIDIPVSVLSNTVLNPASEAIPERPTTRARIEVEAPIQWSFIRYPDGTPSLYNPEGREENGNIPASEDYDNIRAWLDKTFGKESKYGYYWRWPIKSYEFVGFRDIFSISYLNRPQPIYIAERISWYHTGEGQAGTVVEEVVQPNYDDLSIEELGVHRTYISIICGRVRNVGELPAFMEEPESDSTPRKPAFGAIEDWFVVSGDHPSIPQGFEISDIFDDTRIPSDLELDDVRALTYIPFLNKNSIPYQVGEVIVISSKRWSPGDKDSYEGNAYVPIDRTPFNVLRLPEESEVVDEENIVSGKWPLDEDGNPLEITVLDASGFSFKEDDSKYVTHDLEASAEQEKSWSYHDMRNLSARLRGYPGYGANKYLGYDPDSDGLKWDVPEDTAGVVDLCANENKEGTPYRVLGWYSDCSTDVGWYVLPESSGYDPCEESTREGVPARVLGYNTSCGFDLGWYEVDVTPTDIIHFELTADLDLTDTSAASDILKSSAGTVGTKTVRDPDTRFVGKIGYKGYAYKSDDGNYYILSMEGPARFADCTVTTRSLHSDTTVECTINRTWGNPPNGVQQDTLTGVTIEKRVDQNVTLEVDDELRAVWNEKLNSGEGSWELFWYSGLRLLVKGLAASSYTEADATIDINTVTLANGWVLPGTTLTVVNGTSSGDQRIRVNSGEIVYARYNLTVGSSPTTHWDTCDAGNFLWQLRGVGGFDATKNQSLGHDADGAIEWQDDGVCDA